MSKKLHLQIPEPCHESWDKMTPVDKGRFCDSCQKDVIDFTGMSDTQLVAFFKKPSTGSVCGRFNNDQLERDIAIPKKRIPWFKYILQICLPVFIANTKAISQGKPKLKLSETTETCIIADTNVNFIMVGQLAPPVMNNRLQGRVVDEDGNAIPYASIFIKDSKKGVNCDAQGYFSIKVNPRDKFVTLVTSSIGYETIEKNISNNGTSFNEITLRNEPIELDEVVVTSYPVVGRLTKDVTTGSVTTTMGASLSVIEIRRDSVFSTIKSFFFSDSFKVFPNPAKSGSAIKIELKNYDTEELQLELLNLQGQLISSSIINSKEKNSIIPYQLPDISGGIYLLRVKNKKSAKTQTEKIIVQ